MKPAVSRHVEPNSCVKCESRGERGGGELDVSEKICIFWIRSGHTQLCHLFQHGIHLNFSWKMFYFDK